MLLLYPNLTLVSTLPNNIAMLSASLKEAGHNVKLFDTTYYKTDNIINDERRVNRLQVKPFDINEVNIHLKSNLLKDLDSAILSFKPDLIATTVVDDTFRLAKQLINRNYDIPQVVGGVTALFAFNKLFRDLNIIFVCRGEGEKTIVELANALESSSDVSSIKNLSFKNKKDIIHNPLDTPLDINKLPFEDFSIFENKRFYRPMSGKMLRTIPINFDRGCPYSCTFCCAPSIKRRYKKYFRRKTIDRIHEELSFQIDKHKPNFLYFNSETFLLFTEDELKKFYEMYKEFDLPFWCQSRIETIKSSKIQLLKKMGCYKISIGIEHGNEDFRRDVLKKQFTNNQSIKAIKILAKYNIDVSLNNILGFPEETRELIFDTINLNKELHNIYNSLSINGFCFQPYTGTELRQYCIEKKYMKDDINTNTPIGNPVIYNPYLSHEELIGLLNTFVLYVKLPKRYWYKIKKAERDDEMLQKLKNIYWERYA